MGTEGLCETGGTMAFEVFDKRNAPATGAPSVTIQRRGILSLNTPAHSLLNDATDVELLFDAERQVIALRPASPSTRTYKFRNTSTSKQVMLSLVSFANHYGLDFTVSRRYEPKVEDGMLCIDLRGPSVEIRGNRSTTNKSEGE